MKGNYFLTPYLYMSYRCEVVCDANLGILFALQ